MKIFLLGALTGVVFSIPLSFFFAKRNFNARDSSSTTNDTPPPIIDLSKMFPVPQNWNTYKTEGAPLTFSYANDWTLESPTTLTYGRQILPQYFLYNKAARAQRQSREQSVILETEVEALTISVEQWQRDDDSFDDFIEWLFEESGRSETVVKDAQEYLINGRPVVTYDTYVILDDIPKVFYEHITFLTTDDRIIQISATAYSQKAFHDFHAESVNRFLGSLKMQL